MSDPFADQLREYLDDLDAQLEEFRAAWRNADPETTSYRMQSLLTAGYFRDGVAVVYESYLQYLEETS